MKEETLNWLLEPRDPPIRFHTLVDILRRPLNGPEVVGTRERISDHGSVKRIFRAQTAEGYWPPSNTCYEPKWTAAVWPLILLGEMAVLPDARIKKECERFLTLHQMENGAFAWTVRGKRYAEPCLTGNMIRTLVVFGYGDDSRVQKAIDWMPEDQQEDGGWNCDFPLRKVKHGSFMSTIEILWAYSEIPRQKWNRRMKHTIDSGAEFLLMHHLYKSDHHNWRPTKPQFTMLHFPMYYYYDALHSLRVLAKLGYADDQRVREALHLILSKRTPDGRWLLEGDWFREVKEGKLGYRKGRRTIVNLEEIGKPSKWVTLNCFRVLTVTGDLEVREE